jgi:uncharacterized membrane protein YoaK (UPF0700 family)
MAAFGPAIPERHLVWVVAVLASLEAAGAAVEGLLDSQFDRIVLWGVIALAMVTVTYLLERIKLEVTE